MRFCASCREGSYFPLPLNQLPFSVHYMPFVGYILKSIPLTFAKNSLPLLTISNSVTDGKEKQSESTPGNP